MRTRSSCYQDSPTRPVGSPGGIGYPVSVRRHGQFHNFQVAEKSESEWLTHHIDVFATDGAVQELILTRVITPVIAPLLVVVILFDYIMTRVRAADSDGELRSRFIQIGRIELAMLGLMLLFWVPYFILKL